MYAQTARRAQHGLDQLSLNVWSTKVRNCDRSVFAYIKCTAVHFAYARANLDEAEST